MSVLCACNLAACRLTVIALFSLCSQTHCEECHVVLRVVELCLVRARVAVGCWGQGAISRGQSAQGH